MLILSLLTLATAAEPVEATVLGLDGVRAYADLGRGDGVRRGQQVLVYETVEVIDPATGRRLSDRFPLGTLEVIEAGETLSLLQGTPALMMRVEVGDAVLLEAPAPPAVARPVAATTTTAPSAPANPSAAPAVIPEDLNSLSLAFERSASADLDDRVAIWTLWLSRYPDSPLAASVEAERDWLLAELASPEQPAAEAAPEAPDRPELRAVAQEQAWIGAPLKVVLSADKPELVDTAMVYYRGQDEVAYRIVEMRRMGDAAWVADIPTEAIATAGVAWFVGAVGAEGEEWFTGGSAKAPQRTPIEQPMAFTPAKGDRSRVSLFYEYVDFYQMQGVDRFQHFEADILYRINGPLHSVRMGYGVYNGISASADLIDEAYAAGTPKVAMDATEEVGFNFGYTELEFQLVDWLSVVGRGVVGVESEGLTAGVQGRVRLGREESTNLLLGAARIGSIGDEYLIQLNWDTVPKLPMGAGVRVTNQPGISPDEYGVRLVYEARYELTDWVEVGGRLGWQFRNIFHSGPSFGAGAVFSW